MSNIHHLTGSILEDSLFSTTFLRQINYILREDQNREVHEDDAAILEHINSSRNYNLIHVQWPTPDNGLRAPVLWNAKDWQEYEGRRVAVLEETRYTKKMRDMFMHNIEYIAKKIQFHLSVKEWKDAMFMAELLQRKQPPDAYSECLCVSIENLQDYDAVKQWAKKHTILR